MTPQAPLGLIGPGTDSVCGNHLYVPVTGGDNVQLLATLSRIGTVPLANRVGSLSSEIAYKRNVLITQICLLMLQCAVLSIRSVAQVECESNDPRMNELEAPTNCLQYFTKSFGKFKRLNCFYFFFCQLKSVDQFNLRIYPLEFL